MHNEEIILTKNGGNKMTKSQSKNSLRQYLEDLKAKRNEKPKTIPIKKTKEMKRI